MVVKRHENNIQSSIKDCIPIGSTNDSNIVSTSVQHAQITVDNSFAINQGEVGITNGNSTKHILGTFGAGPCVIVTFYNPDTSEAALTHIDALTNVPQTISMIDYHLTKNVDEANFIINLSTGWLDNNSTLELIRDVLSSRENMEISKILESSSLAIDAKTGEIIQGITHHVLDLNGDYRKRMETRETIAMFTFGKVISSRISFDGRNESLTF
ncbi:hypothetical protein [Wolbachia endosymbiont (group A) of Anomoia purmunda]|uniref:hypothetical protein n=1 Tax=Wolbachia endosymbiont (group A) of Anomoia purmunda TaxID=2953978 RepID=UPI002231E25A|nr:hypothetical protein [Wolbachia endosymbiont (group A) of Anomoia purmunda]